MRAPRRVGRGHPWNTQNPTKPAPRKGPTFTTNPIMEATKTGNFGSKVGALMSSSNHNRHPFPYKSLFDLPKPGSHTTPTSSSPWLTWLWQWMQWIDLTFKTALDTRHPHSLGHSSFWQSVWGAEFWTLVAGRRRRRSSDHVGSVKLDSSWLAPVVVLMHMLVLPANMASSSLAVAMPMVGRESVVCGAQEGVWSQVKCQVSSWSGLHGGSVRGGLNCGREDMQVRSWRSGRRAAVTTSCAVFESNGEVGKVEYGVESVIQPIQFEGGQDPPTVVYAPNRRIVAIGDLHGDIERTQWALQLAGVLSNDGQHRWTGGTTVLVQVGDVLDRGEDEIAILSLLACLGKQARSKGGAVFQILGNHETMNVAGDFRYVAPGGFQEAETFAEYCEQDHGGNWDAAFEDWHKASQEYKKNRGVDFTGWLPIFNPIKIQKGVVARTKLLSPGGPLATQLATHGVVLKVNDWLFAHGGVLPHHVDYGLERMNKEVSLWMKMGNNRWGQPAQMPFVAVKGFDSIVWSRLYSKENFDRPQEKIQACGILAAALAATNCRGLIVGHTPQTIGANCKCDGRIWRIDVGMSSGVLHALPEVLEIIDDKVRILSVAEEFLQEDEDSAEELRWKDKMEVQNYRM